ncbi:TPA: hypothetical protein MYL71_000754 [Klebsiella pneumoniae]|nr:hypothetical protein [Klebsiella pneumoniae]
MTTDITELAQSLKAAAIDAKELAIIARYSKGRAAAEKFYALANPNNVIALVEALEKAQETIAFQQGEIKALLSSLEPRTVKLPDALLPATHKSGELFMTPDNVEQGGYLNRDDVLRVLRAAGIKVEAE